MALEQVPPPLIANVGRVSGRVDDVGEKHCRQHSVGHAFVPLTRQELFHLTGDRSPVTDMRKMIDTVEFDQSRSWDRGRQFPPHLDGHRLVSAMQYERRDADTLRYASQITELCDRLPGEKRHQKLGYAATHSLILRNRPSPIENQGTDSFRVRGGEQQTDRTAFGEPEQRRPPTLRRIEDSEQIIGTTLERGYAIDGIGQTRPAFVLQDHPSKGRQLRGECPPQWVIPLQIQM